ncbi:MAG TPA: tetratricopeptide repeat protein [Pirellulales bacterium]|nr:tetratricopeptide repeat protein [Pirellulales bacterium]
MCHAIANRKRHAARSAGQRAAGALLLAVLPGCTWISHGQNVEGVTLYQQGFYQDAIVRFQQAKDSSPNNPDSYYNLAATYHQLAKLNHRPEDLAQAESLYNQCLDRDRDHRDCHRGLAVLLAENGRSAEAFSLLEGWVRGSPSLTAARIELARLNEEFGRLDVAQANLIEAVKLDPHNPQAFAALGRLREQSGNAAQALADYERSLTQGYQPEVAARAGVLRQALGGASATPAGGTRTVNGSVTGRF